MDVELLFAVSNCKHVFLCESFF